MKQVLRLFYNNQSNLYKGLLFAFSTLFIVNLIPIKNQFAYDFARGDSAQYETLYAPFDFAIIKSEAEIDGEKIKFREEAIVYFDAEKYVKENTINRFSQGR